MLRNQYFHRLWLGLFFLLAHSIVVAEDDVPIKAMVDALNQGRYAEAAGLGEGYLERNGWQSLNARGHIIMSQLALYAYYKSDQQGKAARLGADLFASNRDVFASVAELNGKKGGIAGLSDQLFVLPVYQSGVEPVMYLFNAGKQAITLGFAQGDSKANIHFRGSRSFKSGSNSASAEDISTTGTIDLASGYDDGRLVIPAGRGLLVGKLDAPMQSGGDGGGFFGAMIAGLGNAFSVDTTEKIMARAYAVVSQRLDDDIALEDGDYDFKLEALSLDMPYVKVGDRTLKGVTLIDYKG